MKEPIEAKIQVAASTGSGSEEKTLLLYYSNEPNRVNNSDSTWESSKASVEYKSKKYEITIYKIDDPRSTEDEKKKNKHKICRFHYKENNNTTEKTLETKNITDCKGWIGLRDKSEVEKAKGAKG